ncbi:MAG TPA: hypothetical protein VGL92_16120, partial [Acidimicrobiia bacterium]
MRRRIKLLLLAVLVLVGTSAFATKQPADASSWERFASDCFTVDDFAYTRVVCWRIDRLVGD